MTAASDNAFPKVIITEGAAPSSPSAGTQKVYIDSSDHKLKRKNSSGTVTVIEGISDTGTISTYVDLADQGSDPSSPSAGNHRFYSKSGGLYVKDSGGTVTGALGTGGGGGVTGTYYGYNTAGGTTETMTSKKVYAKKITVSSAGLLVSVGAYVKDDGADHVGALHVALFEDNAGTPRKILAYNFPAGTSLLPETAASTTAARWIEIPLAAPVAATDYWIAVMDSSTSPLVIHKDASGSDRTYTSGGAWIADWGFYSPTTTTDKYSIRAIVVPMTIS